MTGIAALLLQLRLPHPFVRFAALGAVSTVATLLRFVAYRPGVFHPLRQQA